MTLERDEQAQKERGQQREQRKRSRRSAASGDDGEEEASRKQRGRPRVEKLDESAADRRRTQIRLAQRAYRQRKETTIASLEKRAAHLQASIQEMNQSFLGLNNEALNSGILASNPLLADQLKKTVETFARIAKASSTEETGHVDEDSGEAADEDVVDISEHVIRVEAKSSTMDTSQVQHGLRNTSPNEHLQPVISAINDHQGQIGPTAWDSVSYSSRAQWDAAKPQQEPEALPFGLIVEHQDKEESDKQLQRYNTEISSWQAEPQIYFANNITISSPLTYSFQESTFARRLQRATLERAYHVLGTGRMACPMVDRIFELSLNHTPRHELASRFREVVFKGRSEVIEFDSIPFIAIGGAGTHYPQRDLAGNLIPKANVYKLIKFGPDKRSGLQNERGDVRVINIHPSSRYDGVWFDPTDVQGYLEERGCRIDPQSSFAEVCIDMSGQHSKRSKPSSSLDTGYWTTPPVASDPRYSASNSGSNCSASIKSSNASALYDATAVSGAIPNSSNVLPTGADASTADLVSWIMQQPSTNELDFLTSEHSGSLNNSLFNGLHPTTSPQYFSPMIQQTQNCSMSDMNQMGHSGSEDSRPEWVLPDVSSSSATASATAWIPTSNVDLPAASEVTSVSPVAPSFLEHSFHQQQQQVPSTVTPPLSRKKIVTIDIANMIEELINRSICLGRTPGFRRRDVDRAFNRSVISVV